MSKLLADSLARLPACTLLPQLLLARRATIQTQNLKIALETSSYELFVTLASSIRSTNTVVYMFKYARKTTMLATRRYWIYQYLLGRGIPSDDVSKALLESLKADNIGDLSLPKLLLEHGAVVGYKNGSAFSLALQANSLAAVKLLSQYIVDDIIAGSIFNRVRKTTSLGPYARAEVYRCLLQWNIEKSSLYHALVDILKDSHCDVSFVRLLLAKGADPNKNDARCFIMASTAEAKLTFQALSKNAEPSVVLKALLNHFKKERDVVRWSNICLDEQSQPVKIDQKKLLVQCMRNFPQTTAYVGASPEKWIVFFGESKLHYLRWLEV